tara:strand:+ start:1844 stop:2077 length:234 start_codon:yes stop_codon:yes gene_type:complete
MNKQLERIEGLLIKAGYSTDLAMDDITGQWIIEITKGPDGWCIDRETTIAEFQEYLEHDHLFTGRLAQATLQDFLED